MGFSIYGITSVIHRPTVGNFNPAFKRPSLMIPQGINLVDLSLSQDKLVLTEEEVSGGIWVLENVDQ